MSDAFNTLREAVRGLKGARVLSSQLAEQDPLINLRQDDVRQELFVSLYGEVQKEVIQATLANDFDLDVEFRKTTTICIQNAPLCARWPNLVAKCVALPHHEIDVPSGAVK